MKDINDKGFEKFESLDVTNNDKKSIFAGVGNPKLSIL